VTPAVWPAEDPLGQRLLFFERQSGRVEDRRMRELPRLLRQGDLLVLNDAATLPASLEARTSAGKPIEVRLSGRTDRHREWTAVLLGRGDWRIRTEDRPAPPQLAEGDVLDFGGDLTAAVRRVSPISPRLVDLLFDRDGDELWAALYRHGRPVQYSYLKAPLALWHVQTAYGARPWAVEPPSAGLPINFELLAELRQLGVTVASLTHAAGLSSTGDAALDALLPLPEHYDIPAATVEAIEKTHREKGRVIAVGTSVVRALEGSAAANGGRLRAGEGTTGVRIDERFRLRVVDGLLTGIHEPGTSHFLLLTAFIHPDRLEAAARHAEAGGYFGHEFGDSMLILGEARPKQRQRTLPTEPVRAGGPASRRFDGKTIAPPRHPA
jgi:S-adenosylmethionine:tRNA ribosyltransferase-isomerase